MKVLDGDVHRSRACGAIGKPQLHLDVPGAANLVPAGVSIGVILLATSAGQMGGVMHLVSGRAVADPVWMRIRGAFKRD